MRTIFRAIELSGWLNKWEGMLTDSETDEIIKELQEISDILDD